MNLIRHPSIVRGNQAGVFGHVGLVVGHVLGILSNRVSKTRLVLFETLGYIPGATSHHGSYHQRLFHLAETLRMLYLFHDNVEIETWLWLLSSAMLTIKRMLGERWTWCSRDVG